MPIQSLDPSIYQILQPPPVKSAAQQEIEQATVEEARAKRQQFAEQQQDRADVQRALQGAVGPDGIPDFDAAIQSLGTNPRAQSVLIKIQADTRKAQKDAQTAAITEQETRDEWLARQVQGLTPENFPVVAPMLPPELRQILGDTFDAKKKDYLVSVAQATKDYHQQAKEATDHYLKGDYDTAIARQIAVMPQAADHILQDARENWNVPSAIIDRWKAIPPDQLQQVAKDASLTEDQRQTLAGQKETRERQAATEARQAEQQAQTSDRLTRTLEEQMRHNRVTEGISAARAAATKNGGNRPVTSGDANKIAEMRNSLRDLSALRSTLTETSDATGTLAAAEAALPNWVTNATSIGVHAKSRQAVIDRVKQVIGKALEGGVLRKEDEYKYIKILPVISDNAEVAAAKLDGLEAAINRKLDEHLSSLEDAGYNTTRFRARAEGAAATPKAAAPKADPLGIR